LFSNISTHSLLTSTASRDYTVFNYFKMVDRTNNEIGLNSIMPSTEDKSYFRLRLNDFRQTSQFCDVL